ncbi:RING-H2 finger protein ATL3 [Forsythia ovata]|uniref:RING-type E3 ubiquitin transferase n=1 Tax=Forsythia ovata TaxID=205694 RepID=A0ABD1PF32_9LAMI
MEDSPNISGKFGESSLIEVTGKVIIVVIILLVFVVVSVFCVHLYSKWFWNRRRENSSTTTTGRRHQVTVASVLRCGLDSTVLKTIPVVIFDPKEFKDGLECAVCLSEVSEGEKTRLLPKCNHGFHMDCIDMWFQSHSTCPLCRDPISNQNQSSSTPSSPEETVLEAPIEENSGQPPNFPTNVLFWGNETQVSTLGPCLEDSHQGTASSRPPCPSSLVSTSNRPDGVLVIDIPRQFNEEEDEKSPAPSRLRSLKRLLSGNIRFNPWSPRNVDMEQGSSSQS